MSLDPIRAQNLAVETRKKNKYGRMNSNGKQELH